MAKRAYTGVSNTARKINKGYIGVAGVARKIKESYIGVNGIARPTSPTTYTITITSSDVYNDTDYCYIEINGTRYIESTTLELDAGTIITCYGRTQQLETVIMLNGESVGINDHLGGKYYDYVVNTDASIELKGYSLATRYYGTVTITEK